MTPLSPTRRHFLHGSLLAGTALAASKIETAMAGQTVRTRSSLTQPPLPFAETALEPHISAETIGFHYGKHHKAYFDNVNKAVSGMPLASASLEEIIVQSAADPAHKSLFNNAAQAWNHNFYWQSLSPKPQSPSGKLNRAIARDFGSLDALKSALAAAATGQFGSGWGWLVVEGGKLKVISTSNADLPFIHDQVPLLTIDVWEHAYYLDYQNRRADYVKWMVNEGLNWDFAARNFRKA